MRKPVSEIMSLPDDELTWWQAFFDIEDHGFDKEDSTPSNITTDQSIEYFKKVYK